MQTDRWRWANVSLPEPYLAALAAAAVLHRVAPIRFPLPRAAGHAVGWPMMAGGIGLIWWAVRSAAATNVDRPTELVTTGAYAVSRNPMYLGWSLVVAGIAAVTREAWVLVGSAIAGVALQSEVLREEARLSAAFGDAYAAYCARVPRILGELLPTRARNYETSTPIR